MSNAVFFLDDDWGYQEWPDTIDVLHPGCHDRTIEYRPESYAHVELRPTIRGVDWCTGDLTMTCDRCGADLGAVPHAKFCWDCGAKLVR